MWLLDCRCGCTARWSLFSTRGSDTPSMRSATTPYLDTLHAKVGTLEPYATSIGGWTAGDHGLSRADAVSLDLPQMLTNYQTDPGHVARLCVHEMTHAYSRDRSTNPPYWADFSAGAAALLRADRAGPDRVCASANAAVQAAVQDRAAAAEEIAANDAEIYGYESLTTSGASDSN